MRLATLDIHKEEFSFSAGHFTIFSATDREQLHGHNYYVSVSFEFAINHNGISFDYRVYKRKIAALCTQLDRYLLLPSQSPYLSIEEAGDYWIAEFNHKKLPFLKEDVVILPLANITIEELSMWFLEALTGDTAQLAEHAIRKMIVRVYNGPGQSGGATWNAS